MVQWNAENQVKMLMNIIDISGYKAAWDQVASMMGPEYTAEACRGQWKKLRKGNPESATPAAKTPKAASKTARKRPIRTNVNKRKAADMVEEDDAEENDDDDDDNHDEDHDLVQSDFGEPKQKKPRISAAAKGKQAVASESQQKRRSEARNAMDEEMREEDAIAMLKAEPVSDPDGFGLGF